MGDKKKEIIIDTAVFSSGLQAGNGVWEHGAPEQQLPFFFFFFNFNKQRTPSDYNEKRKRAPWVKTTPPKLYLDAKSSHVK